MTILVGSSLQEHAGWDINARGGRGTLRSAKRAKRDPSASKQRSPPFLCQGKRDDDPDRIVRNANAVGRVTVATDETSKRPAEATSKRDSPEGGPGAKSALRLRIPIRRSNVDLWERRNIGTLAQNDDQEVSLGENLHE
jgi:hypothetical protein